MAEELPLSQQVGRLVVLRFNGTSAPDYVREVLGEGRAAGRDPVPRQPHRPLPGQAPDRGSCVAEHQGPPLICVDQEGGDIRILPWAPPERSQAAQAAAGTVRADAEAAAEELRATGINVSLAPVADVAMLPLARRWPAAPSRPSSAPRGQQVAESVRGWRAGGVAPTIKHFPGLGGATVNTDDGPATIRRSEAADPRRGPGPLPLGASRRARRS